MARGDNDSLVSKPHRLTDPLLNLRDGFYFSAAADFANDCGCRLHGLLNCEPAMARSEPVRPKFGYSNAAQG